jgi:5-formyltetrahydrofolate cyclo-ligase
MHFREVLRETTLRKNTYGIWEPVHGDFIDVRLLDIVVTPLVAFDEHGNRIGMGGGYFDRCFSFLRHRTRWLQPKLIGLAFDCQKVEEITPNPWDIPLYRVYSE